MTIFNLLHLCNILIEGSIIIHITDTELLIKSSTTKNSSYMNIVQSTFVLVNYTHNHQYHQQHKFQVEKVPIYLF